MAMKTADDMVQWVDEHVVRQRGETPLDMACWFVAYREASAFLDGIRTKDIARMIEAGDTLGGPYKTIEHLRAWWDNEVQMRQDDEDLTTEQANEQLWEQMTDEMYRFFHTGEQTIKE